jgi:hypothetical protein
MFSVLSGHKPFQSRLGFIERMRDEGRPVGREIFPLRLDQEVLEKGKDKMTVVLARITG